MKTKTYEQIAAQIYHRVEQGKKVDDDYLVNITDSIKEQENLQDYITKTNVKDNRYGAIYDYSTKSFTFYGKRMEKSVPKSDKNVLEGYDKEFYQYLQLTRLLLKEMEYAQEIKLGNNEKNTDLKAQILRTSYCQYINWNQYLLDTEINETKKTLLHPKKPKNITKKYEYDKEHKHFAPEEYYAQVASYEYILEITELLELERIKTLFFEEICNFYSETYRSVTSDCAVEYFRDGKKSTEEHSPVLYYLEQIGFNKAVRNHIRNQGKQLSAKNKLKLGLEMNRIQLAKIQATQIEIQEAIKLQRTFIFPQEWLNFK